MIIKTKKFTLRPYRKGDERSLQENINDRHVYRYTCRIPHPYTIKDAKEFINNYLNKYNKKGSDKFILAIEIDGQIVGALGLEDIKKHMAEMGYWIGKKYWNKGIMTEAVRIMTRIGFRKYKLTRIYAQTFLKNTASRKVLEKNGYKIEGIMRKDTLKDGKLYDSTIYAKLK